MVLKYIGKWLARTIWLIVYFCIVSVITTTFDMNLANLLEVAQLDDLSQDGLPSWGKIAIIKLQQAMDFLGGSFGWGVIMMGSAWLMSEWGAFGDFVSRIFQSIKSNDDAELPTVVVNNHGEGNQTYNAASQNFTTHRSGPIVDFTMLSIDAEGANLSDVNLTDVSFGGNSVNVNVTQEQAAQYAELTPIKDQIYTRDSGLVVLDGRSFIDCRFNDGAIMGFNGGSFEFINSVVTDVELHAISPTIKNCFKVFQYFDSIGKSANST